jgi:hypothetical protein
MDCDAVKEALPEGGSSDTPKKLLTALPTCPRDLSANHGSAREVP